MKFLSTFTPSDWVQIILTLIGFIFTGYQLIRTKDAAFATKKATEKTFTTVKHNLTIESVTKTISGVREITTAIRGDLFERALFLSESIIEDLMQIKLREGFIDENTQEDIQEISVYFQRLIALLSKVIDKGNGLDNKDRVINKLNEHNATMHTWIERVKFE